MKIIKKESIKKNKGVFVLVYSVACKTGKTTTLFDTVKHPALCIYTENRNVNTSFEALEALGRSPDVDIVYPSNHIEMLADLHQIHKDIEDGKFRYKTLIFDSLSYYLNVLVQQELTGECAKSGEFDIKAKPLVNSQRLSQQAWGFLAGAGIQLCQALNRISQAGVSVFATSHGSQDLNFENALVAQPYFIGKAFTNVYSAFFDAIGLLTTRTDKDGNVVYPPIIDFSPSESHISAYSGKRLKSLKGVFNAAKIFS